MSFEVKYKDSDSTKDYQVDWAGWLGSIGADTIASVEWIVEDGITHESASDSNTNTTATIWLSGGEIRTKYKIVCRITTANSPARIEDKTFYVQIREN